MENKNKPISPAQEETGENDPSMHKISMRIDLADGSAFTTIRSGSMSSDQQQDIILNIMNALKAAMQNFGSELIPLIKAAVSSDEYSRLFPRYGLAE